MPETLVVDASVALKWLLPEEDSEEALGMIGRAILAAPDLMRVEAANALWHRVKRLQLTAGEARACLADLAAVPMDYVADRALTAAALSLACDLGHPVCDCLYLALALERAGVAVTADRRFAASVASHPYLAGRVMLLSDWV